MSVFADLPPASLWLADTFIYTSILIALVLVLRRPVARFFGPNVAYMLWALPLIRFIMPPFVLPASMAPKIAALPVDQSVSDGMTSDSTFVFSAGVEPSLASEAVVAAVPLAGNSYDLDLSLGDVLLPIWLLGAALFLGWRTRAYLQMRRDLLADARPAGETEGVRLVETPRVGSPVAFGIIDKVVALPPNFMAWADVDARDLAIEHELSHHRGYDLVANIAAQPLLALHWFNPLAWWGWRAMKTDQEAACDARVVAGREAHEKASYAEVIAGFAAGSSHSNLTPNLGLVAPMACPVLGEKSIIQRLRSLSMNEVPTFRRRIGLIAIGAAGLALPMTASVSYAAPLADPAAAPLVPSLPLPPSAPLAPQAPIAPLAPDSEEVEVTPPAPPAPPSVDGDAPRPNRIIRIERTSEGDDASPRVLHREIHMDEIEGLSQEERAEFEAAMAEIATAFGELEGLPGGDDIRTNIHIAMASAGEAMAEAHGAMAEARASMEHSMAIAHQNAAAVSVSMQCDGEANVVERDLGNGRKAVVICQAGAERQARDGITQARRAIMEDDQIPDDVREDILRELDQQIEAMGRRQVSYRVVRNFRVRVI